MPSLPSLPAHEDRVTSPLADNSNPASAASARSSTTEREPSPFVRITPSAKQNQQIDGEQTAHLSKKVRFDLNHKRTDSIISESESEDPLAPNATVRKNPLGKQTQQIAASSKVSPLDTAKSSRLLRRQPAVTAAFDTTLGKTSVSKQAKKPAASRKAIPIRATAVRRKSAAILDQFKEGSLIAESDEDEQAPEINLASEDTVGTLDLAEQAIATIRRPSPVEVAVEPAAGTRRSQRAPKPKDHGDVEVHGWKTNRIRKS